MGLLSPQLVLKCTTEWFWKESGHPWILNYPLMVAQILTLLLITEGVKYKNLPAVLTFVDFWKAFTRSTGARSLEYWKLMEYLKKLWKRQKYYTSTQLCKSSFQMVTLTSLRSMLVYCKGAPCLFIVTLDYAMGMVIQLLPAMASCYASLEAGDILRLS